MPSANLLRITIICFGLLIVPVLLAVDHEDKQDINKSSLHSSQIQYRGTMLIQLRVSNLDRAVHFYQNTLGLKLLLRSDELRWAKINTGIPNVVIGLGEGPDVLGSGTTSMNIGVVDIDQARRKLEKRGVQFKGDTITIPGVVKLADFFDPDGNMIRLAQGLSEQ